MQTIEAGAGPLVLDRTQADEIGREDTGRMGFGGGSAGPDGPVPPRAGGLAADRAGTHDGPESAALQVLRAVATLAAVRYRKVTTPEDWDRVARLRHACYAASGFFKSLQGERMMDESDLDTGAVTFALHHQDRIVATMRLQVLTAQARRGASLRYFPQTVGPLLDQGQRFIDCSRFAVDPQAAQELPGLHLVAMRLVCMIRRHLDYDATLAPVRREHMAFYRRMFTATVLQGPTEAPELCYPVALVAIPRANEARILERLAFFRSTAEERAGLFGDFGLDAGAAAIAS